MKFKYTARTKTGAEQTGVIETADEKSASNLLHEKGLVVIGIRSFTDYSPQSIMNRFQRVGSKDLAVFTRQLSTMVGAGLNLIDALHVLEAQVDNFALKTVLQEIVKDVQGGNPFSRALSRHPGIFSPVYVNIVKAGETSGGLDVVMIKLADTMEKQEAFERRVRGALVYPAIVLVAMIAVIFVMNVFVIPKISVVFADQGARLPLPTQIVLFSSNFFVNYWYIMLIFMIAGAFAFRAYAATPDGKAVIATVLLKIPVIGTLVSQSSLTTFTRIFSILVASGVTIIEALKIGAEVTSNYQYKHAILEVADSVEKGSSIAAPIARQKLFPPILGQMVSVGEETGKIDEVLEKLSRYFESETDTAVKALTTAIEPLVIIILGLLVGFLVIAVILPLYSLTDTFSK